MATTPRNIRFDDDLYEDMKAIAKRPLTAAWHIQEACRKYLEGKTAPPKPSKAVAIAKPKPSKAFIKPTVDELAIYFHELGSGTCNDDANSFYDHFESNGWKVGGKAAMKSWKAACRNWNKNKTNFKQPKAEVESFVDKHTDTSWRDDMDD